MKELEELLKFVQEMREEGDTDLRTIIYVIKQKIKGLKDDS